MKSTYGELKEQAWQANMEIPRRGLAIYTFGNVSAFDAERAVFAIKPSGVAYESLTAADMVVVDLDAKVVEGTPATVLRHEDARRPVRGLPGNRRDRSHAFDLRDGLGAGPHADPDLRHDPRGSPRRGRSLHGAHDRRGGRAAITKPRRGRRSSIASARAIPHQTPMVLVAGHGPFAWGKTADKAVYHAVVLEELAKMASITRTLDPARGATAGVPRAQALRAQAREERLLRAIVRHVRRRSAADPREGSTMRRALRSFGLSGLLVTGVLSTRRLRRRSRRDRRRRRHATQHGQKPKPAPQRARRPPGLAPAPRPPPVAVAPAPPDRSSATSSVTGYFRGGFGASNQKGRMTCFQLANPAGLISKYRLGNECEVWSETHFTMVTYAGDDGSVAQPALHADRLHSDDLHRLLAERRRQLRPR